MHQSRQDTAKIATVKEYFRRGDAGRRDLMELFTEDVQFYFPKFGIGTGKRAFAEFATGLMGSIERITHDMDALTFIESGDCVVVEGMTSGIHKNGQSWRGGKTPGGRFSSVFEFRDDGLIRRMYIYLDPDYLGMDKERFLWGEREARW